jgi:dihydroorotate dehydrogenase
MADLSTTFTGLRFPNPFLLASAPPTESDSNILRAFEAGWGGVVTKTIGLHPVVNVKGPKTKFLRADNGDARLSMTKRPNSTLMASWNWELISDKTVDWWMPRLTKMCQDAGVDGFELNFSCPHMDRIDMGSNVGKDKVLCSVVTMAVKEAAKVPVWVKLTPATANIVEEAEASIRGGADAISSSNTFPSLPLIDPNTLDFEANVEGYVSSGGLGGPAILPLSLAKMAQLTKAFPDKSFSGIGGVSNFDHALCYILLGCGTVQVCTAAMLDSAIGPNVIKALTSGMAEFMDKRGYAKLDDFRGIRRDRVVAHSQIKRPEQIEYHGGYDGAEEHEGYAKPAEQPVTA